MPVVIDDVAVRPSTANDSRRWFGVYTALVSEVRDPDGLGRVKVRLPWAPDAGGDRYEAWARVATMMAGRNRGSWFMPDVDDEVLVAFEAGDPRRPYVVGALWNGIDTPPAAMDGGATNHRKVLRSRSGLTITMDDTDFSPRLTLETPAGQRLTLADGAGHVEIRDENGSSIVLAAAGVTVTAAATVEVRAAHVSVAAGMVTVDAGMARFSGVVQAETIIANSVVSASYTPGAGNIW
jgi:uncharacterized protein involved in type VI secretion and phage assembly